MHASTFPSSIPSRTSLRPSFVPGALLAPMTTLGSFSVRASFVPPPVVAPVAAPAPVAEPRETSLESWTDADAREALARYEGTVRVEARRLRSPAMRTNTLDEEDLRAEGRIAVLEALRRFQGWGVNESTWVRMRVRQRMVDAIRKTSLWSRLDSRVLGREGRGEELTSKEQERARAAGHRQLVSFDAAPEGHASLADTIADTQVPGADDVLDASRRATNLRAAIAQLAPRPRLVVERVLVEGQAARDVATELGVSESRISQILHAAVPQLRDLLGENGALAS